MGTETNTETAYHFLLLHEVVFFARPTGTSTLEAVRQR